jgi:DNA-binding NarL/FixJ family response regulator
MSQRRARPTVAIIDAKELRRASITSLFEAWARAEKLRLTSFTPDQAHEALQADTDVRMLIFSIGGESIAERQNLQQLKVLRALVPKVPLVIISDRDDANDITAAFTAEAQGFINSGMPSALAFQTLSFILNGGSYFPPSLCINFRLDLNKPSLQLALRKIPNLNPKTTGRRQTAVGRRNHEAIWNLIV